jgi:hypothetical protein
MARERKPLTEEQRAKAREAGKRWRLAHPEKVKADRARYQEANRARIYATNRAYKKANRAKMNEYNRRYYHKMAKIKAMLESPHGEEIRVKVLGQNEIFAAANKAVPRGLPAWKRDDIISDIVLAVLEGQIAVDDIRAKSKDFIKEHNRMFSHLTVEYDDNYHGLHAAF